MSEFIVWDKDRKVWIDESYPFYINSYGLLCIQRNDKVIQLETDCEIFKPIGIEDINDKKRACLENLKIAWEQCDLMCRSIEEAENALLIDPIRS